MQNIYREWGISDSVLDRVNSMEAALGRSAAWQRLDRIREHNQLKVLKAFQDQGIAESHFGGTTGYGYNDEGRERLDRAMAQICGAERAIVRAQITTGTQAIAMSLFAVLRPGDELLSVTGPVYDSLESTIGHRGGTDSGSLSDFGVSYREVPLSDDGPDLEAISAALRPETRLVFIQRSRGYSARRSLLGADIRAICRTVREAARRLHPDEPGRVIIFVDNCYGEFVEAQEPIEWGADLIAGSMMKNPGGGLAPTGGYVAGLADLVELAASRLTAPGLGSEVGPTLGLNRVLTQGLYLAPHVVSEVLKGMSLAAAVFADCGFETWPGAEEERGDVIQTIVCGSPEAMAALCQAVQHGAPVDSFVTPVASEMPGYGHEVIMAAGTFVSGATLELSADGPVTPPYMVYLQGGLVREQVKLTLMLALEQIAGQSE